MLLYFGGIVFIGRNDVLDESRGLTWQQLTAPLEDKPLTAETIADWLNGEPMAHSVDVRCTELQEVLLKFSLDEIKAMDRLDQVERHDQEIDSGDNYTDVLESPVGMIDFQADSQPYIPNVGEECKYSTGVSDYKKCLVAGFHPKTNRALVDHLKIGKSISHAPESWKFRPLKSERDLCMDAIKEGMHESVWNDQIGYYGFAVDKLIKAGKIK
jgi:hypothetical protein